MKIFILSAAGLALASTLALAPLAAHAQATGEKMEGSPNASGMMKAKGHKSGAMHGTAMHGSSMQSKKMKGPPNADGAGQQ